MKRRRSILVLVFAIALGVLAAGLVLAYMQQVQQNAERAAQAGAGQIQASPNVPVLVAMQDIPIRTRVTAAMVRVMQVPTTAQQPNAYSAVKDVDGKVTRLPIAAGQQIIPSMFAYPREEAGLAFAIPPSKRAVSITTSEVIGAGGMVVPGDHVDVIGIFKKDVMGKDEAAIILQNIEVLAVAQSIEGQLPPAPQKGPAQQVGDQLQAPQPTPTVVVPAVSQPQAKTVTLSVSPEEAQRLVLAESEGNLRLALRPYQDSTIVNLPPSLISSIQAPLNPAEGMITGVEISPANARVGDTMTVKITVKNTSNEILKTEGPAPGFAYVQGQTFQSQNFPSQAGTWRVGISMDTQIPVIYPYRWGFGGDLPPGASTTVTGTIKLTYDMKSVNFWAGLIKEPADVVQDNVGTTLVTIVPADVAVVSVDVANVRSGPSLDSSVIAQEKYGTQMPITGRQADWYKVKLPDGREGYVAAGWIIAPPGQ